MYVVTVTFEIRPDRMPEFLPLMRTQARASLDQEPGCHRFDICLSEDGHSVFLYEIYRDKAAFEAHLSSPHFKAFDAAAALLVRDKKIALFRLLD